MKTRKIFKIIKRKPDCIILLKSMPDSDPHSVMYQVRDIENDIIYMGYSHESAESMFNNYDINKVRAERKEVFEDWLAEFAEA